MYVRALRQHMLTGVHRKVCKRAKTNEFCPLCVLSDYVKRVANGGPGSSPIEPVNLVCHLRKIAPDFVFGRQQDAHEFLRFMIAALQKCEVWPLPALSTLSVFRWGVGRGGVGGFGVATDRPTDAVWCGGCAGGQ